MATKRYGFTNACRCVAPVLQLMLHSDAEEVFEPCASWLRGGAEDPAA